MPIKTLRITNAGPFDDITFEFDEHVNVFVGPNNSGKSTALLALAEATVYPFIFPTKFLKGSGSEWEIALTDGQVFEGVLPADIRKQPDGVGLLPYIGFSAFVPSLRQSTDYRAKAPSINATEQPDSSVGSGLNAPELLKRSGLMRTDAALVSDESVIQKMVDYHAGYPINQYQIHRLLEKIAGVASEITEGYCLKFLRIGEDKRGLFPEFGTPDGDLPLNVLSQGTQSTLQWVAHFMFGHAQYYEYPENLEEKPGILIIDEIDVHLHPSWQRQIIPALTKHFPNLQVFCSTHSPLMLAGLGEGQVQLLNRDAEGKVTVSVNDFDVVGWSADEILRNVQGIRNTTDLDTSKMVDRLGELRRKESLSESETEELEYLRGNLNRNLLGGGGPAGAQIEYLSELMRQVQENSEAVLEVTNAPRPTVRRRQDKDR